MRIIIGSQVFNEKRTHKFAIKQVTISLTYLAVLLLNLSLFNLQKLEILAEASAGRRETDLQAFYCIILEILKAYKNLEYLDDIRSSPTRQALPLALMTFKSVMVTLVMRKEARVIYSHAMYNSDNDYTSRMLVC